MHRTIVIVDGGAGGLDWPAKIVKLPKCLDWQLGIEFGTMITIRWLEAVAARHGKAELSELAFQAAGDACVQDGLAVVALDDASKKVMAQLGEGEFVRLVLAQQIEDHAKLTRRLPVFSAEQGVRAVLLPAAVGQR